jgi:hypothetical protein
MKTIVKLALALAVAASLAVPAVAGTETVNGKIMCAKCALKKADADKCQDMLVAKDAAGKVTEYYIEKNDVAKAYGHTCQGEKPAVVTGTVSEKDGKKWISPTKMEAPPAAQ